MKEHLYDMLMERAERFGSREVFRFKKTNSAEYGSISWTEVAGKVKAVSSALYTLGFRHGDNVGIFSDNKPEWTISDFGILGVRGVVVPFYATSSKQQLKYIVDETKMRLIFVGNQEQYEKALWLLDNTETVKTIVVYDSSVILNNDKCIAWDAFCELGSSNNNSGVLADIMKEAQSEDLATIIYTSGTTGEPKGVMLDHATFFYCFQIHDERLDVVESDMSACFLPLSHVFERTWTYFILYRGASNAYIDNPREIVKYLPVIKPTLMCTVPRFFEKTYEGIQLELSKWPTIKQNIFNWAIAVGHRRSEFLCKNQNIPTGLKFKYALANKLVLKKLRGVFGGNIKFMPCAGAAISPKLLRFFHAAGIFVNYGYGATETTATVSCFKEKTYDFDTCGSIMPGIQVKISDQGEILVKGSTVFKGYYNKPEVTQKSLIDGWYHTGDQGFITPSGNLVMQDRIKDLMKTSVGKYVSPQKIELLFGQDPFIEQVIAIGDNRKYVTALIVPSFEMLKKEVEKLGVATSDNKDLAANEIVNVFYTKRLEKIQEDFTPYEKVVKFKLLSEPFSIQNGLLTNTLKVRRNELIKLYSREIEEMYSA
ncbi:MAG: long-chain fatty acid--CoA ligase [Bacteroidales bacterium]|nr:MAG: long-chain fatty acid--CoA ligase [Bacteroidales bacterium]